MTRLRRLQRRAVFATTIALGLMALLGARIAARSNEGSVGSGSGVDLGGGVFLAILLALTAGAGYFTYRVPSHVVPWLLLGVVVSVGVGQMAFEVHEGAPEVVRLVTGPLSFLGWWPAIVLGAVFLPLLFPTGHPPSPRWVWVAWVGVVALVGIGSWYAVAVMRGCMSCAEVGIGWLDASYAVSIGLIGVAAVGSLVSLAIRFRNAAGVERKQLQWLLFPLAVGLAGLLLIVMWDDGPVTGSLFLAGVFGLPIGVVVAITRYRLYEIDRVISRTISYTVVVGVSSLVFAAGAIWLPQRLTGTTNSLGVAVSTLAVAALFNPMRRRVTRVVERRFNRLPYEPDRVVADLRSRLRGETDLVEVAATFESASSDALSPTASSVWLREAR